MIQGRHKGEKAPVCSGVKEMPGMQDLYRDLRQALDLKVQVGQVISDLECWYKEIDDRESQFPEQSSNRVKAMSWGIFIWKLCTRWNWVGQSRGQLQLVDVPPFKRSSAKLL